MCKVITEKEIEYDDGLVCTRMERFGGGETRTSVRIWFRTAEKTIDGGVSAKAWKSKCA